MLLITLVGVVSVVISYFVFTRFIVKLENNVKYEKSIVRNTSNLDEQNALTIAENSNYSDIFKLRRFVIGGSPNETWPYTWANFIDTQVIEYYDDRFENLKGIPESIEFRYAANVSTWNQIRVTYVPAPEGGNIHDDAIQVLSPDGSVLFENAKYTGPTWGMIFAYRNDSKYQKILAEEIDLSLSKSHVIEMTLIYNEIWAPIAAFYAKVYQIVIVNQDFVPLLFCVQSRQLIS